MSMVRRMGGEMGLKPKHGGAVADGAAEDDYIWI